MCLNIISCTLQGVKTLLLNWCSMLDSSHSVLFSAIILEHPVIPQDLPPTCTFVPVLNKDTSLSYTLIFGREATSSELGIYKRKQEKTKIRK